MACAEGVSDDHAAGLRGAATLWADRRCDGDDWNTLAIAVITNNGGPTGGDLGTVSLASLGTVAGVVSVTETGPAPARHHGDRLGRSANTRGTVDVAAIRIWLRAPVP